MQIAMIYFSGTGVTEKYTHVIQSSLLHQGTEVTVVNITQKTFRDNFTIKGNFDAYIFGFPTYGSKIPRVCKTWLESQEMAIPKPAAIYLTYGGRAVGDIHNETIEILHKSNFNVFLSAEFLGAHSFNVASGWDLLENRPNDEDYALARKYASNILEYLQKPQESALDFSTSESRSDPEPSVNLEKLEQINWSKFYPKRVPDECSMCRMCEVVCPNAAFDADTGTTDPKKCIRCMKCVQSCPDHVITLPDLSKEFQIFKLKSGLTEERLKGKISRIFR